MRKPFSVVGHVRPRLLHLTTTDISLDWLLLPQLRAFAAAGYEVMGASGPGPHVPDIEAAGIRHVPVTHATRSMDPRSDTLALFELVRLFRGLRPDIVHTHNPKPGLYGRLAAQIAGVPIVVNTIHGLYATTDDPPIKRRTVYGIERMASYWSDANLVQNPEDVDTLLALGLAGESVVLLGNGIDLERFDPQRFDGAERARLRDLIGARPEDVVVGAVGRLVWEKGLRELFDAAKYVRGRLDNVRFVVIGPDDESKSDAVNEASRQEARAAGVVFLGRRDDIEAWYTAMDCYVLASHREGFPRSAMEAAAMGLPLVATDVRGCRQVVTDGLNGHLVPARDAVALAEAVATLVDDAAMRTRMGFASRLKALTEFDQNRVIETTLAVYERLIYESGCM